MKEWHVDQATNSDRSVLEIRRLDRDLAAVGIEIVSVREHEHDEIEAKAEIIGLPSLREYYRKMNAEGREKLRSGAEKDLPSEIYKILKRDVFDATEVEAEV